MEHAQLVAGKGHEVPIARPSSPAEQDQNDAVRSAGKKAAPKKVKPARPRRKEMSSKSKSGKLV